jgi:hypothetical protein
VSLKLEWGLIAAWGGNFAMTYTLAQFTADCRDSLMCNRDEDGHEEIREDLERLLADRDFVARYCGPDAEPGIHTVYHDTATGFHVLVHVYETGKTGPPHDHGDGDASWAVFGQAVLHTDMTTWRRTDCGSHDGHAELEPMATIRLGPAMAAKFERDEIHSIEFPNGARFVRVTGTDLDRIPTRRFDPGKHTVEIGSRLDPLPR